jgi:hypothetical protein
MTATGGTINFNATATTTSGGNWLTVTPGTGPTPFDVAVSINPVGLAPGLYSGTVNIVSTEAGSTPIPVPVSLIVGSTPLLSVTPGPLNFTFAAGGTPPANQPIQVASTGSSLNYTVSTATATANNWLVVAPVSGVTNSNVTVGVNPLGLGEGTFTGVVTVTSAGVGNSPVHVPVNFVISTASELVIDPAPLIFEHTIGGGPISQKSVNVSSSGTILSFSATASTLSGGNWLSVVPTAGLTPTALSVTVNPAD